MTFPDIEPAAPANDGRQHFLPAAFIGRFAELEQDHRRRRRRTVWVADRRAPRPFQESPSKLGVSPRHARLYDSVDGSRSLDPLWSNAEGFLGTLDSFIGEALSGRAIPANLFITGAVPFVSSFFARPQQVALSTISSLGNRGGLSELEELDAREAHWYQTVDQFLFNTRWTIIPSPSPLVTTDLAYQWMPGEGLGRFFIPLHPGALLMLSAGRSYYLGDDEVIVETEEWSDISLREVQTAMMLHAPNQVYCHSRAQAKLAKDFMSCEGEVVVNAVDLRLLGDGRRYAMFSSLAGAADPTLAALRFHLAIDTTGSCDCMDFLQRAGWEPDPIARFMNVQAGRREEVRSTLPTRPTM